MQYTHDIVATTGTYKNANGEEKKRYTKCGAAFTDDQGRISLKLDAFPCSPDWSGWLSLYDKDRDNNRGPAPQQPQRQPMRRDEFGDPVRYDDNLPGMQKGAVPRPVGDGAPF